MDITPLVAEDSQIIQSYSAGGFKISGKSYDGAVAVFPDRAERWEFSGDFSKGDFEAVLEETGVDVVLLGCGARGVPVDAQIRQAFADKGVMIEPMDTGAACRTYNVLMAEGRRVAALLIPV